MVPRFYLFKAYMTIYVFKYFYLSMWLSNLLTQTFKACKYGYAWDCKIYPKRCPWQFFLETRHIVRLVPKIGEGGGLVKTDQKRVLK